MARIELVMSMLSVVIQIALIALLARGFYLRYFHPLARYPGPALAAITNLWKFFTFFGGKHHIVEQDLHDKLGPIVRTGPNSLSISSLAGFEAIYGFHKSLEKGDFYDFGRDGKTGAGSIFSARNEASHREHRKKVFSSALSTSKVASYEPVIEKNVSILLSRLTDASFSTGDTEAVNIAPLIHRFAFDALMDVIYGEPMSPQPYTDLKASSGILEGFRSIAKFAWGSPLLPWFGWLMLTRPLIALTRKPTYDEDGNLTGMAALVTRMRNLIFEHPEQSLDSSQPSVLRNWLLVSKDDSRRMEPDEMFREVYNLTFAGSGSTSAGLTSILMELGTQEGRHWQTRIRDELKRGHSCSSSPALMAVMKETFRLRAPFPTAFPRTVAAGAENALSGIVGGPLPAGTTVASNTFVLGQSKEIWGDDARLWKPQRWLGTPGEVKKLDDQYLVFSKGPRSCIGKDIAWSMMASAVSSVLQKWAITFNGDLKAQNFLEMHYMTCGIIFTETRKT